MKSLLLISTFAFTLLTAIGAPGQPAGHLDKAAIDHTLKGLVDKGELIGVSALITINGKEAYFGAYGLADREANKPMTRDTIVQIYSMTKPLTGVALMQLWEQGKFRLDDPVTNYIPELANVKVLQGTNASGELILAPLNRPMTIRDLGRHTSGLTGGDSDIPLIRKLTDEVNPRTNTITLDEVARRLGTMPLEFQPGEKWRYSYAVDMQALLVQRLSGQPFDVYLQEHVLKPLGMTHTSYFVPPEQRAKLAAMYDWKTNATFTRKPDEQAFEFNTAHWPLTPGSFGLTSTLDDYSRFARMLLNGGELDGSRVLQPATVRLMSTSTLDPANTNRSWLASTKGEVGFGIDFAVRVAPPKKPDENPGAVGEFFWDGLANTLFWVDPKNHFTAVIFTQFIPFGKTSLHREFRAAIYSALDPTAMPPK
jgi:CubicO group peptidase (beta-lactamase class C family)